MKLESFKTLEETLTTLKEKAASQTLSVRDILEILSGRGRSLLLIFLSLPFCQPLQIPGLSTPFGLIIAFVGLRMSFSKHVWLPKFLMSKQISSSTIDKIATACLRLVKKMQKWLHPRWLFFAHHPSMHITQGLVICFLGLFLALPLPIPLTNLVAAWLIFIIALGILEDDGLFIFIGIAATFLLIIIFIVLSFYGIRVWVNHRNGSGKSL